MIRALAGSGANVIYVQAVRSHGGDGDPTHNPFRGGDPSRGVNPAVLEQWSTWFEALDEAGVIVFLVLYDDGARPFGNEGAALPDAERRFVRRIVDRFERRRNLVWCVAEEYREAFGEVPGRVRALAAAIARYDDHGHPIAVHHAKGDLTMDFRGDSAVGVFALQSGASSPEALHADVRHAVRDAEGRWPVVLSENWNRREGDHPGALVRGDRRGLRQRNWAAAMAGGHVMVLGAWGRAGLHRAPTPEMLADLGRQRSFFEATDFSGLRSQDDRARGSTRWVLSDGSRKALLYASEPGEPLGLAGLEGGRYVLGWLDPASGARRSETLRHEGGVARFERPAGFGPEAALRLSREPLPPPGSTTRPRGE